MRVQTTLLAAALLATACGASTTSSGTAWLAAHPDPPGVHFAEAQGLCVVTVRYPTEAPGEIDYNRTAFIQMERGGVPASPGKSIGTSGDWTVHLQDQSTIVLLAPGNAYTYRAGAKCGSNSAAPT
jgi:hypothetical protein